MEKKVYDLIDDLLETDVLKMYRQVLTEEKEQVKSGGRDQFGYLPTMTLSNIGAMNAESFCERTISCAGLIVTDFHTSLSREYDNIHSQIEVSETRISKELRDKVEQQVREVTVMDDSYQS